MRNKLPGISLGLCALALWAGAANSVKADQVADIVMAPRLTIQGTIGVTNQIQYADQVSAGNWAVLTNVVVTESPYYFVDVTALPFPRRFYQVVVLAPPGMVLIPAGNFTMGATTNAGHETYSDEVPQHAVYVSAFYMDQYEVTTALWDEVKGWNGGNGYVYENVGFGKAADHPVQTVNWRDCVKWCNARSQKEGLVPCYYNEEGLATVYKSGTGTPYPKWDANGYRLPTEAEWEKAARGGESGHRFSWSDTDNITHSQANYYAGASYPYNKSYPATYHPTFATGNYPYTSPVGHFGANGYGLYEMTGNVWEWCWDWYGPYSSAPQTDPRGPASGSSRVLRGGSWYDFAAYCRTAYRYYGTPYYRNGAMGFRSVRCPGQ